ncbi:unnamed protein product [Prorocentrum cordatum]|uniref:Pentatricopeptide repeat-containing protein n=1 Tax=Prorocentrum cordatum TaxID=2364126 RepID=A0ABN9UYI2_9DINO|nr:unnamed protein product [Polarella glacialis]
MPHSISYNAGISACEKGEQWQRAMLLLIEMREAKLQPDVTSYSAGISACEKGIQWQKALSLLSEMREVKLEADILSYSGVISAGEKASGLGLGCHWPLIEPSKVALLRGPVFASSAA